MSRFVGGVLCAAASVMAMLCALHLSARESAGAALFVTVVALGLLLGVVASTRAGTH